MKAEYAQQVIDFFKKNNINTGTVSYDTLYEYLCYEEVDTSARGITKLINVSDNYFSKECRRKVPLEIQANKPSKGISWIHYILLLSNKCPVCKGDKRPLTNATCSVSCANTLFRSGINNPNVKEDSYRVICFSAHGKKCIICGEENIVAVHHYDENHSNNHPSNLVPMCPTHHTYMHSSYKHLIENKVKEFLTRCGKV